MSGNFDTIIVKNIFFCHLDTFLIYYTYGKVQKAQKSQKKEKTWVPFTNGHSQWAKGYQKTTSQRKKASNGIIFMLKKQFRLRSGIRVLTQNSFSSPLFTLKIGRNALSHNCYRFVISKKIDKRAVVRNRVKRLLSHAIEGMNSKLMPGYDMIVVTKKPILENMDRIQEELREVFKKARILK